MAAAHDSLATKLMTAEQLLQLPSGLGERFELVQGELKTMSPTGSRHGRVVFRMTGVLHEFLRTRSVGEAFGAETGFVLSRNPDTVRAPDVSFVTAGRVPAGGLPDGYFPGAPDLAIEVISPNDAAVDVQRKADEYFAAGTQLVWIVYPDLRSVVLFRSAQDSHKLTINDTLDGGALLPGFACPLGELFA